jgi:hypothetical protein
VSAQVRVPTADPAAEAAYVRLPSAKRSGWLITGAAVLSFVALGALGLSSSRVDAPQRLVAATQKQPVAVAPRSEPAKPAAAAPATEATLAQEASPAAEAQGATPASASQPGLPAATAADPAITTAPAVEQQPSQPAVSPAAPAIAVAPNEPAPSPALAAAVAVPPAPEPAQVPTSAAAPAAAAPAQPPGPTTVHVRISAVPKHAEITLDGRAIPNPFEADVVASGKHRVEASALGHRSADVTIAFDQDQKLALRLERVSPAKPRTKPERTRPTRTKPAPEQTNRGAGFVSESPY